MWPRLLAFTLLSTLAIAPWGSARAQSLSLFAGTLQFGGDISITFDSASPGGQGETQTGIQARFNPSFGIFVVDGLELLVSATIQSSFGDLYDDTSAASELYALSGGVRYYFGDALVIPTVGAELGYGRLSPDSADFDDLEVLTLSFPVGVLFALSDAVGLEVGVRINYLDFLGDGNGSRISVPMGYLGVQAFVMP